MLSVLLAAQARFLLAKLNPSSTHESQYGGGEIIFTDDVSLQVHYSAAILCHAMANLRAVPCLADAAAHGVVLVLMLVYVMLGHERCCKALAPCTLRHPGELSAGALRVVSVARCCCRCSWTIWQSWQCRHEHI